MGLVDGMQKVHVIPVSLGPVIISWPLEATGQLE